MGAGAGRGVRGETGLVFRSEDGKIGTYFCFERVSVHIWSLFWPI